MLPACPTGILKLASQFLSKTSAQILELYMPVIMPKIKGSYSAERAHLPILPLPALWKSCPVSRPFPSLSPQHCSTSSSRSLLSTVSAFYSLLSVCLTKGFFVFAPQAVPWNKYCKVVKVIEASVTTWCVRNSPRPSVLHSFMFSFYLITVCLDFLFKIFLDHLY